MSTLEQEIEKLSIKTEHASQKFNELRDLLIDRNSKRVSKALPGTL